MEYVVDFDDLVSANIHKLELFFPLRERFPDFRVTCFTIPNRITRHEVNQIKARYDGWVALAPHGWEHTRGECLSWTTQEAVDKIKQAQDMGIDAPIFRGPAWLIAGAIYEACQNLGLTVASHKDFHLPSRRHTEEFDWKDVPQYIYNMPNGRKSGTRACHGHITPVAGNHIEDMTKDGRLSFPNKATFIWPWEAAVQISGEEGQ